MGRGRSSRRDRRQGAEDLASRCGRGARKQPTCTRLITVSQRSTGGFTSGARDGWVVPVAIRHASPVIGLERVGSIPFDRGPASLGALDGSRTCPPASPRQQRPPWSVEGSYQMAWFLRLVLRVGVFRSGSTSSPEKLAKLRETGPPWPETVESSSASGRSAGGRPDAVGDYGDDDATRSASRRVLSTATSAGIRSSHRPARDRRPIQGRGFGVEQ